MTLYGHMANYSPKLTALIMSLLGEGNRTGALQPPNRVLLHLKAVIEMVLNFGCLRR